MIEETLRLRLPHQDPNLNRFKSLRTRHKQGQNRLPQVKVNGQQVLQGVYDEDGRRIETIAGDTTVYDYLAGSWDPAYMKDLTTGTVTDVVFAGDLRIGKIQAGINYYYHLDRLGSVRLVTKTANVQSFSVKYQPYGTGYATSGAESFQYTGKQLDTSTGLYYFGYRYYDSQTGRFTSPDLAGPNYLNPQSLNRYVYALNNPMVNTDPTGAISQNQWGLPEWARNVDMTPAEVQAEAAAWVNSHMTSTNTELYLAALRVLGISPGWQSTTESTQTGPPLRVIASKLAQIDQTQTIVTPFTAPTTGQSVQTVETVAMTHFIGIPRIRVPCDYYSTGQSMIFYGQALLSASLGATTPPTPAYIPGAFGPVAVAPGYEYAVLGGILIGVGLIFVGAGLEFATQSCVLPRH